MYNGITEKHLDSISSQTYLIKINYTYVETNENWTGKSTIQVQSLLANLAHTGFSQHSGGEWQVQPWQSYLTCLSLQQFLQIYKPRFQIQIFTEPWDWCVLFHYNHFKWGSSGKTLLYLLMLAVIYLVGKLR